MNLDKFKISVTAVLAEAGELSGRDLGAKVDPKMSRTSFYYKMSKLVDEGIVQKRDSFEVVYGVEIMTRHFCLTQICHRSVTVSDNVKKPQ